MKNILTISIFIICAFCYGQPSGNETFVGLELYLINNKTDTITFQNNTDKKTLKSTDNLYKINFVLKKNNNFIDVTKDTWRKDYKLLSYYYISYLNADIPESEKYSELLIFINKGNKKMTVNFKIYKERLLSPWNIKMNIPFQKGIFEITDPEKPILISTSLTK